jgi:membrane fusion protein, multidrug efflux system
MSPIRLRQSALFPAAVVFASVIFFSGCTKSDQTAGQAAPRPPMEVGVLTIKTEPVTLTEELPGRLSALRVAEVRARINGIVQKRLFTEGSNVTEGQVLFQIDAAPYQAVLDSARANLARAEASYTSANIQAERFKGLVATNAIAKQTYDDATARQLSLQAEVAAAQAAVQSAEINLGYTRVTAPISGRIGRAEVTEGAYVQAGTATLLATVQQLDSLYVDLSQSADDVIRLKQALATGQLTQDKASTTAFHVILDNGTVYPHAGSLQFSDISVNRSTGTVSLRGTVPNPDMNLLPGMFVRARLDAGTKPNAILVPQSAVTRNNQGKATTLVIGADGKVELRILQISQSVGNQWLVAEGLQAGDQVIIDHLQKIRPGSPVKPTAPVIATQ